MGPPAPNTETWGGGRAGHSGLHRTGEARPRTVTHLCFSSSLCEDLCGQTDTESMPAPETQGARQRQDSQRTRTSRQSRVEGALCRATKSRGWVLVPPTVDPLNNTQGDNGAGLGPETPWTSPGRRMGHCERLSLARTMTPMTAPLGSAQMGIRQLRTPSCSCSEPSSRGLPCKYQGSSWRSGRMDH